MKIMSVDYGDARTGVAFCDAREILASAYCVIKENYMPKLIDRLVDIADKERAEAVVIGLPRNMDGSYGYRADECKALGDALGEKISIPIYYEDERLTTVIAHDILSSNNVHGKKRKNTVDAVSAVVILQSFIDKKK
ncbi:MAG: Holliday junction resolvase RuvX [Acetobacter sp.]|nr:Holliday junction resolvase RuvX [Bacteroides sp.]MCM1341416.1 Holliday junction resolvase RuvX [Acetobacter sp.]MCM1433370.1 Holliday junction resolvase RuvX [Clostridiales bacterium]